MRFDYFVCILNQNFIVMNAFIKKITKREQKIALSSINSLLRNEEKVFAKNKKTIKLKIQGIEDEITIPLQAFMLLRSILNNMAKGKSIALLLSDSEISTQQAADILNVSRPHVIKLLEKGVIPYKKVGTHRRIQLKDLLDYETKLKKAKRKDLVMDIGSGGDKPIVNCLTHKLVMTKNEKEFIHDPQIKEEWFLEFDISETPLNYPFVIMYNVIYKNGFQGSSQFTGVDINRKWEKISMSIKFPERKKAKHPLKLYKFQLHENTKFQNIPSQIDTSSKYNGSIFCWNIEQPEFNHAYRVQWEW